MKKAVATSSRLILAGRKVAAITTALLSLVIFLYALMPTLSPPANPYEATNDYFTGPVLFGSMYCLGFIGLRAEGRGFQLAALIGLVTPSMLILIAVLGNFQEIRAYWHLP